jgi:hypothetical protein
MTGTETVAPTAGMTKVLAVTLVQEYPSPKMEYVVPV